ncbi:MAG: phosphoribosylanthranilate isomerase [Lachnospiraceae bacterium]|nr:phosphoribosylanthranilate isomerase [Lachnospiraceae bacterium]
MQRRPQIKICGITRVEEAAFLNEIQAEYAGFVFWEKSRRNVPIEKAEEIRRHLQKNIKSVAVTVSPDLELLRKIEQSGFDLIQIHGCLRKEILENSRIAIWQACNLKETEDLKKLIPHENIRGYVLDAGTAGGGRTFDWQSSKEAVQQAKTEYFAGKTFVLAGGLHPGNVSEAVRIFSPDVVDVSSGVESEGGKERRIILEFAEKARNSERTC